MDKVKKTPKPGQFYWHNGILYRAKKRTFRCHGCALDNFLCPNIVDSRNGVRPLDCALNNIILVHVKNENKI